MSATILPLSPVTNMIGFQDTQSSKYQMVQMQLINKITWLMLDKSTLIQLVNKHYLSVFRWPEVLW